MSEYNLGFSEKLTDAAQVIVENGLETIDAKRTVLYLSLLASEITLKALLEKAGVPLVKIKARWHNLSALLGDVASCKVEEYIGSQIRWVPAARLRAETVDPKYADATVGKLLEAEAGGASVYPNQIRYGDSLNHYPPETILKMATVINAWATKYWEHIRV